MSVNKPNAQYLARKNIRIRIRDAMRGIDRLRSRGTFYIPLPDTQCDTTSQRYLDYISRTYYVSLPTRTVTTLAGLIANNEPDIKLSSGLEYLRDNCDDAGTDLEQQIKAQVEECLVLGNCGVAVIPKQKPDGGVNAANAGGLLPTITAYKEEQIINWRVKNNKLTMVVLRENETVALPDDPFADVVVVHYRVFMLTDSGVEMRVYRGADKNAQVKAAAYFEDEYLDLSTTPNEWAIEKSTLTLSSGKPMAEIPFSFIGANDNSPGFDNSPILNICDLAIKYYAMSADEQLNVHLASCGVFTIASDMAKEDWDEFNKGTAIDTSWGALFLGAGGRAEFVQANEAVIVSQSMDRVLKNAVSMGAQIITDAVTDKTATEARINNSSNTSQLVQIANNISDTYTRMLRVMGEIVGDTGESFVQLSTEFFGEEFTPDLVRAQSEAVLKGTITQRDFSLWLKRVGYLESDRTVDQVEGELQDSADEAALSGQLMMASKPSFNE